MSKTFRFRLQPVLDWRKQQADIHQQTVAKEQAALDIIIQELDNLQSSVSQVQQAAWSQEKQEQRSFWQNYSTLYVQTLRLKQQRLEQQKQAQQIKLNQARMKLLEHRLRQKSLEVLADKQQKAFIKTQEKAQEAEMDELAQRQYMSSPWA